MPVFSTEWLQAVAGSRPMTPARKLGRADVPAGIKLGDRAFRLTFDVFDIMTSKRYLRRT